MLLVAYSLAALIAPPIAQRVPHAVRFGKVSGEDRGANPMDPPIEMNESFFSASSLACLLLPFFFKNRIALARTPPVTVLLPERESALSSALVAIAPR